MRIVVNGEETAAAAATIGDYIRGRGLDPRRLVVEHNRVVVPAEDWDAAALSDGDRLEILSFVGGG